MGLVSEGDQVSVLEGRNAADWMLEVTSVTAATKLGVDFAQVYAESTLARCVASGSMHKRVPPAALSDMEAVVDACGQPAEGSVPLEQLPNKKIGFLAQLRMLLWRFNIVYWRVPQYNLFRVGATALVVRVFTTNQLHGLCLQPHGQLTQGLVFGSMFFGQGSNVENAQELTNILGSMYLSVRCISSCHCEQRSMLTGGVLGQHQHVYRHASGVHAAPRVLSPALCGHVQCRAIRAGTGVTCMVAHAFPHALHRC